MQSYTCMKTGCLNVVSTNSSYCRDCNADPNRKVRVQSLPDALNIVARSKWHWVMVARYRAIGHKEKKLRHLKLYRDTAGDPYVRTGKRGAHRKYLKDMASVDLIPLDDGHLPLFYENPLHS